MIDYNVLCKRIVYSRAAQLIINEKIRAGIFKIPVHLALGHEAISEAISSVMHDSDKLICSHRNIHYQFSRGATISNILEEFQLSPKGLAAGKGGAMNLINPTGSIVYTSSILGNNLCVSTGVALSMKMRQTNGIVIVITGDGAMEEGAFYESIENARSFDLKLMIVVENNNWSLASRVEERRKPINLAQLALALGASYSFLSGNEPDDYLNQLIKIRERIHKNSTPEIVEVGLTTLGGWILKDNEHPNGKFINYHAGLSPRVMIKDGLILSNDESDPVYLIKKRLGVNNFDGLKDSILERFSNYL